MRACQFLFIWTNGDGMNRFEQLTRELKRRGRRYGAGEEGLFDDHSRRLNWHRLVRLNPEMTLDELASYAEARDKNLGASYRASNKSNFRHGVQFVSSAILRAFAFAPGGIQTKQPSCC